MSWSSDWLDQNPSMDISDPPRNIYNNRQHNKFRPHHYRPHHHHPRNPPPHDRWRLDQAPPPIDHYQQHHHYQHRGRSHHYNQFHNQTTSTSNTQLSQPQTRATGSNGFSQRPSTLEVKLFNNPLTTEIAIDCEMVEAIDANKRLSALARVSVVNSSCQPLLDTYVNPMHYVTDYRTPYSGIRPEHLINAPTYHDVRECVVNLVSGRTLIGHDLKQDLAVLGIENLPDVKLRDTSRCYMSFFKPNDKPSLKRLAAAVLGQTIQVGAHDSLEDAKAAMKLYKEWLPLGRDEEEATPVGNSRKSKKHNNNNNNHNNNYYNRNHNNNNNNNRSDNNNYYYN